MVMVRGRMVTEGVRPGAGEQVIRLDPMEAGCHGASLIPTMLGYPDYNRLFVVPFCHSFFYGVMRDFLAAFLGKGAVKRAMQT